MYKVIYFGSSHHSLPALEALHHDSRYEIVAVVSQPDKPVGRKQILTPTPVSQWAREHEIELLLPTSWKKIDPALGENDAVHRIKELAPDLGVLAYYGRILWQPVIDAFPKGIVNIHPSLLPKYRGPTPGNFVILNGETESGVSIMLLELAQDAGPVLAQEKFALSPLEIPETYYTKGFAVGTQLLMKVLPGYLDGTIVPVPQDHSQATDTPLLSRDNGKIDWGMSREEIERMVRAFTPWPGTWTDVWVDDAGKLYIEEAMRAQIGLPPDHTTWPSTSKKRLKVLDSSISENNLVLDLVQLEGETSIDFSKFLSRIV
jgi:methionyl-tRNA formyltransferase